jgi:hypothetical protein
MDKRSNDRVQTEDLSMHKKLLLLIAWAFYVLISIEFIKAQPAELRLGDLNCRYIGRFSSPRWINDDLLLLSLPHGELYDCSRQEIVAKVGYEFDEKHDWYFNQLENRELPLLGYIGVAFLDPEGQRLVTFYDNGLIRYWRTSDWSLEKSLETDLFRKTAMGRFYLTADKKYVSCWCLLGLTYRTLFFDWRSGKIVDRKGPDLIDEFSQTGKYALSINETDVTIWSYPDWNIVKSLRHFRTRYLLGHGAVIRFVNHDEHLLVLASGRAVLFDWRQEKELVVREIDPRTPIPGKSEDKFSYLGDTRVVIELGKRGLRGPEGVIHGSVSLGWYLWDFTSITPILEFAAPQPFKLSRMGFSPGGKRLYVEVKCPITRDREATYVYLADVPPHWYKLMPNGGTR